MSKYGPMYLGRNPHLIPVVEYIKANPGCTTREISAGLGIEVSSRDVQKLRQRGVIRRIGLGPSGVARWSA